MPEAQIITLQSLSTNYPQEDWNHLISRPYFIQLLESKLKNNTIVFLSGDEGIGKTILLAQFGRKYYENTFSVFFNPFHKHDLTINFVRTELVNQINFFVNPEVFESTQLANSETFQMALHSLKRKIRPGRNSIYFLVDGLEGRGAELKEIVSKIIKELPLGESKFRFIISGTSSEFIRLYNNISSLDTIDLSVPPLTSEQVGQFLGEHYNKIENRTDIITTTKGYPSRVKVLKRLLKRNRDVDFIISDADYQNWIHLDCEVLDLNSPLINSLLSLICFSEEPHSIEELSEILDTDKNTLEELIHTTQIISFQNTNIQFPSEQHLKFFKNALRGNKKNVEELLLKHYASAETIKHKFQLSKLLKTRGDYKDITELIDNNFLKAAIESTGSLEIVNESIQNGFEASNELKEYSKLFQFSMQAGFIYELDNYLYWESEILARISLNDFKGAVQLAEKAVLNIDRLRLLSLIARKEKELNSRVDDELIDTIKHLYNITNLNNCGDVIYDVVANLIYSIPNLAIEMIEKAAGNVEEANINDWVIAKLSIAAVNSAGGEPDKSNEVKNKALEKLNNPSARKIQRAIEFLVGNYSSNKVLQEIKSLNDSTERINLLRLWLRNNKSQNLNVFTILDRAIDELLKTDSKDIITIDVLVDLTSQLAKVKDVKQKSDLLSRFESFDQKILNQGQIQQSILFEINILDAYHSFKKDKAEHLLIELINKVESFEDQLIKLEAQGFIYQKLSLWRNLNLKKYYHKLYHEINASTKLILKNTASQARIMKTLVSTLGKSSPDFALDLIHSINTEFNRDSTRLYLLDAYLDNSIRFIKTETLENIASNLEADIAKEIAITRILERFSDAKSLPKRKVTGLLNLLYQIDNFKIHKRKLEAQLNFLIVISKNSVIKSSMWHSVSQKLEQYLMEVDEEWESIHFGYFIASELSKINPTFAKHIFDKTSEEKQTIWLDSKAIATTYLVGIRLLIKSYSGLIKNKINDQNHYKYIDLLISRISSKKEKLLLWSEIAVNSILSSNMQVLKKAYDSHIIPLISELANSGNVDTDIAETFVVIHHQNMALAEEYMEYLTSYVHEEVCVKIMDFYIQERNPFEYYSGDLLYNDVTYDNSIKAVGVLKLIKTDSLVYYQMHELVEAIIKSNNITTSQKNDLAKKLQDIIEVKLPDSKNITHNGYLITCKLELANLRKETLAYYKSLIEEIDDIPNLSDKIFTTAIFLDEVPWNRLKNSNVIKSNLYSFVKESLNKLPSNYEYLDRSIHLTPIMYKINRNEWKALINEAFSISFDIDENVEKFNYQKRILDSVHKLDPTFSKELLKISLDNPEQLTSKMLSEYHQSLEIGAKMLNNQELDEFKKDEYRNFVTAVHKTLGSLNSGKCSTKNISKMTPYLEIGRKIALTEAYPIYKFFIANLNNYRLQQARKSNIFEIQESIFKRIFESLTLVELLAQKRKITAEFSTKKFIDKEFQQSFLIHPNSREEALQHIRNWIDEEVSDYIIIVDPYLVKEDLQILKIIQDKGEDLKINFLTCRKPNFEDETSFEDYWSSNSDQKPPFTNFTFCYLPDKPDFRIIHDRWILSKNSGLKLGTSLNSLGKGKESEISILTPNIAMNTLQETINQYLNKERMEYDGKKIKYSTFSI